MKSKKIYFYKLFQIRQVVIKGTMIKFEEKINWIAVLKLEGLDMKIEKEREKKWNEMKWKAHEYKTGGPLVTRTAYNGKNIERIRTLLWKPAFVYRETSYTLLEWQKNNPHIDA